MAAVTRLVRIRDYVVHQVGQHPQDIARLLTEKFGISRQAANKYLQRYVSEGLIAAQGQTKARTYALRVLEKRNLSLQIAPALREDAVWREAVQPVLSRFPDNVVRICEFGFTEMLNNVVDHSQGSRVVIQVSYTAASIEMHILDNGIGIFNKIKIELNLDDERHAILELVKGKLTTDPTRHTGEGIFFTSRAFDHFMIHSGTLNFSHLTKSEDWLVEDKDHPFLGTAVKLQISTGSKRNLRKVFSDFAPERDDYGFSRTRIPVFLARYGDENLVSRSQAKRLLSRFERFKVVVLDFNGIQTIGHAFADEIFRVFAIEHPDVTISTVNANKEVSDVIRRARTNR